MKKGFTLIELLISLTLASLLLITGMMIFSVHWRAYSKLSVAVGKKEIRQFLLAQMAREVRSADSIRGSSSNRLKIVYGDSVTTYDYADQKVRKIKDKGTAYLTEAGDIKHLSFDYPLPGLVAIELDGSSTEAFCRNEK